LKRKYHVHHFGLVLTVLYVFAVVTYVAAEHHTLGDSVWWAFTTFTTVGYGDQYPRTFLGRCAGMMLVSTAVFIVVPAITARVVQRFSADRNEWTHEEQEEVKGNLRRVLEILEV
jgi:voltage-gated potassium channel